MDKVKIHVCNTDKKPYVEYTLHKVIIGAYDIEAKDSATRSHSILREVFTINAVKVEMSFISSNTALSTGYDLEKAALA